MAISPVEVIFARSRGEGGRRNKPAGFLSRNRGRPARSVCVLSLPVFGEGGALLRAGWGSLAVYRNPTRPRFARPPSPKTGRDRTQTERAGRPRSQMPRPRPLYLR